MKRGLCDIDGTWVDRALAGVEVSHLAFEGLSQIKRGFSGVAMAG